MSVKYSLKEAAGLIECKIDKLKAAIKENKLKAEKEKITDKQFKYLITEEELISYAKKAGIKLINPELKEISDASDKSNEKKGEVKKHEEKKGEVKKHEEKKGEVKKHEEKKGEVKKHEEKKDEVKKHEEKKDEVKKHEEKKDEVKKHGDSKQEDREYIDKKVEEKEEDLQEKYQDALKKLVLIEEEIQSYKEFKQVSEYLQKELEFANYDFNEQAKEYETLLRDYEKIELEKHKQDQIILEAEQTLLDMVEQYKELAEDTYSRDKKITELSHIIEDYKSRFGQIGGEITNLEQYKMLEENYTIVLMENAKLKKEINDLKEYINSMESKLKTEERLSVEDLKEYQDMKKKYQETLEDLEIYGEITKRYRESQEELKNYNNIKKKYEETLEDMKLYEEIKKKYEELQEELKDYKDIKEKYDLLQKDTKDYEEIKKKYEDIVRENEKLHGELKERIRQIGTISNIHKEIEKLQLELKSAKEYIVSLEEQLGTSEKSVLSKEF